MAYELYEKKEKCSRTWHFTRMSKKSSSGSLLSLVIRWSRTDRVLLCVRRSPGRLLKLALWSSSLRLWELARRSRNSSVLGDTTETGGAVSRKQIQMSQKSPSTSVTYRAVSALPHQCAPCPAPECGHGMLELQHRGCHCREERTTPRLFTAAGGHPDLAVALHQVCI